MQKTFVFQEDALKSLAVTKVLEYFGFDQSEALAFSDDDNDLDMLEMAGLGVAMFMKEPSIGITPPMQQK